MEDERCCGSGTCIINAEGACWCGQRWNGARMCFPETASDTTGVASTVEQSGTRTGRGDDASG
jgi:hypothetical protein